MHACISSYILKKLLWQFTSNKEIFWNGASVFAKNFFDQAPFYNMWEHSVHCPNTFIVRTGQDTVWTARGVILRIDFS